MLCVHPEVDLLIFDTKHGWIAPSPILQGLAWEQRSLFLPYFNHEDPLTTLQETPLKVYCHFPYTGHLSICLQLCSCCSYLLF